MDAAVTKAVNGQKVSGPVGRLATTILKTLKRDYNMRPTTTQLQITHKRLKVSPICDLVGTTSSGTPIIVEIKCGKTAGSTTLSGQQRNLCGVLSDIKDTWRNRAFAQLALQHHAAQETSRDVGLDGVFKRLVSLLLCVDPSGKIKVMKLPKKFLSAFNA